MNGSDGRITQLDGLRFFAVAAVFLHHAFNMRLMWMGVDLFFVLSGYLITGILINSKQKKFTSYIGDFYARRSRRILPPYLVMLALVAVFYGVQWLHNWYIYLGLMNFRFMLRMTAPQPTALLWSLAVEEQFYLVWPILIFFLSRRSLIFTLVCMMAAALGLRYLCTPMLYPDHWSIYMLLPFRMDALGAGAMLALLWPRIQQRMELKPQWRGYVSAMALLLLVVAVATLYLLGTHGYTSFDNRPLGNALIYECTLMIASACFILARLGYLKFILTAAPIVWLGRISYSMYLIHLLVLLKLPGGNVWLAALITITYASLMWIFLERPLLAHGKQEAAAVVSA